MFCNSNLMEQRHPERTSPDYTSLYCTLNYFVIPTNGNLVMTTFFNQTQSDSDPSNALWACITVKKPSSSIWLGHNAPVVKSEPKGVSAVFVDGGAMWVNRSGLKLIWVGNSSFETYVPVRN